MNNIHDENKIYCKEKKENKNFDSGARYMPFLPCFILSTDTDTVVTDALFQRILVMLLGDHVPHWSGNGLSFFFSKRLNAKKEGKDFTTAGRILGLPHGRLHLPARPAGPRTSNPAGARIISNIDFSFKTSNCAPVHFPALPFSLPLSVVGSFLLLIFSL